MNKMKVRMIADAQVGNETYGNGREYLVDPYVYNSIKQSCVLMEEIPIEPAKESKRIPGIYRVLVVISHGIGNVINKTPLIRMLHEKTGASIDLLVDNRCKDILAGWDIINKIYIYGTGVSHELNLNEYDIIINTIPSGLNIEVLGLKSKVITGESRWLNGMHEVEANIEILRHLKISGVIPDTHIPVKQVDFPEGKYIGISAGYIGEKFAAKNWGYKKFAALIELLRIEYPEHKAVVFGIGKDRNIFRYLQDKTHAIDCVDKYSLQETAYLISKCDFMVCNDTGLGHIAGAVGVKTYSIFGPSNIVKNHPWIMSNVISRSLPCQPCQYTANWTKCKTQGCMDITPETIIEHIKKNETRIAKRRLGVIVCTYNRFEMLYMTLNSLKNCDNFTDIKICIINDGSNDPDIQPCINRFINSIKSNVEVKVILHKRNYGKGSYSQTLKEGVQELSGCKYILFMPDDIIVNKGLFDVVKKSFKYFNNKIKVISFMTDSRASRSPAMKRIYLGLGDYDKFFEYVGHTDGFLALFETKTLQGIEFENYATAEGSNTWTQINKQLIAKGVQQLRLKQSLCLHVGNISSIMNPGERSKMPIRSINVVLFDTPKILKKNK